MVPVDVEALSGTGGERARDLGFVARHVVVHVVVLVKEYKEVLGNAENLVFGS